METKFNEECHKPISDNAILLKKMRDLKGYTRRQVGITFNLSHKTIEKLENGRGLIDDERLLQFAIGLGYKQDDIIRIKNGNFATDLSTKNRERKEKCPKRSDRRFCTKKITKECKVIRELRRKAGYSQSQAGLICGYNKATIGHIENGRIQIPKDRIRHIVTSLGFTYEDFKKTLEEDQLEFELVDSCHKIMSTLDQQKLKTLHIFLQSFKNQ